MIDIEAFTKFDNAFIIHMFHVTEYDELKSELHEDIIKVIMLKVGISSYADIMLWIELNMEGL